jgi:hypothetical protein
MRFEEIGGRRLDSLDLLRCTAGNPCPILSSERNSCSTPTSAKRFARFSDSSCGTSVSDVP